MHIIFFRKYFMEYIYNQCIDENFLLSYKGRTTYGNLGRLINHTIDCLPFLGLKKTGNVIFTLKENNWNCVETILDVELLIPIEKPFKSNEYYVYKPRILVQNAIKFRYCIDFEDLSAVKMEIEDFISKNNYPPLNDCYFKIIENKHTKIIDIYHPIGVKIV